MNIFVTLPVWGGALMCFGWLAFELFFKWFMVGLAYSFTAIITNKELAWAAAVELYYPACRDTFLIFWAIYLYYYIFFKDEIQGDAPKTPFWKKFEWFWTTPVVD